MAGTETGSVDAAPVSQSGGGALVDGTSGDDTLTRQTYEEPATAGGWRRWALLVVAAVIAGAGIAYELALMLLGTVTVGSTERANAIVVGTTMLGMGIGAAGGGTLAKRPVAAFVRIEVVLAALGAMAAPLLYWVWAQIGSLWGPLLVVSLAIGICIGAEMPLLAALNERLARQTPATVVSHYTAADYFGALVGAIAFAFAVRPQLGIVNGAIAVAGVNLVAAATVPFIVAEPAKRRPYLWVCGGLTIVAACALAAPAVVSDGRQALFRDPIVATVETGYQEIVVTSRQYPGGVVDTRLFLNGDLQLSSVDEHRYHEALVHPVIAALAAPKRVLILGGGDCLAAREVLRHRAVAEVTMIELDPAVVELMRTVPELAAVQGGACDDSRLRIINADAFTWVDRAAKQGDRYDAVIVDFPDPDTPALGRLYSVEFFALLHGVVGPGGSVVVQCGSPFFSPKAYWTCADTLEAAAWSSTSYHVDVPSFGDWGFHLATTSAGRGVDPRRLNAIEGLRYLDGDGFRAALAFPLDVRRDRFATRPSTILDPSIVEAAQETWIGY